MEKIELDIDGIKFQQNRYPYLLIDYANEIIPGKSAEGYKICGWMIGGLNTFPRDPICGGFTNGGDSATGCFNITTPQAKRQDRLFDFSK